jgi:hypothetical protein
LRPAMLTHETSTIDTDSQKGEEEGAVSRPFGAHW